MARSTSFSWPLPTTLLVALCAISSTSVAQVPPAPVPATEAVPAGEGGAQAMPEPEPVPEPQPDESVLGGPGESCRARADCKSGLKCIGAVCTDELEGTTCQSSSECGSLRCIQNVCTSGVATGGGAGGVAGGQGGGQAQEDSGPSEWMSFQFGEGTHGFAGISMMGGPAEVYVYAGGPFNGTVGVEGAFAFEFYGGVMFDRFELAAHFSPVATKPYDVLGSDTNLALRVTAGGYIPITDMVSWVLRGGVGFLAVNSPFPNDDIVPQIQADLVGVAIHVGHLNIEVGAPSFRLAIAPDAEVMIMNWLFGVKTAYVF